MAEVNRARLRELRPSENSGSSTTHPRSLALFERAKATLVGGVPMNWMQRWPGGIPIFVDEARGAHFVDVDGHSYIDFCLGDTGAMTGHAPPATVEAIARAGRAAGITTMLPTEDAIAVGDAAHRALRAAVLADRDDARPTPTGSCCGSPATRPAAKGPRLQLVLPRHRRRDARRSSTDGRVQSRAGNIGPPVDPALTTKIVEFNDVAALEAALAPGDVACVLAEPALTNIGIVAPDPGFHDALREITRRTGTLLVIDETHTICVGPGGAHRANGASNPTSSSIGKPIAGGMPAAAFGMTAALADAARGRARRRRDRRQRHRRHAHRQRARARRDPRHARLDVLPDADFARMIPLAERWADGVHDAFTRTRLPWSVNQLGARAEYWFSPPPRNGARGRGRGRRGARRVHAPLGAQPRHPAHAVPQHGADVAGDHRRRRRRAHRGVRRRRRRDYLKNASIGSGCSCGEPIEIGGRGSRRRARATACGVAAVEERRRAVVVDPLVETRSASRSRSPRRQPSPAGRDDVAAKRSNGPRWRRPGTCACRSAGS